MADEYLRRIQHVYKRHYAYEGGTDGDHKKWMRNPDLRVLTVPAFCRSWREFVKEGTEKKEFFQSRMIVFLMLMPFGPPSHVLSVCTSNTNDVCRSPHSACSSGCVRASPPAAACFP